MLFLSIEWDPSIELVKIGSFAIRYYSLMFVIAFVLGLQIMKKIFKKEGVSLDKLDSLFIYTVIATLLGARLGHFLFYDTEFLLSNPLEVLLPVKFNPFRFTGYQGLASHGAAIGIIIAMYFYSKKVVKKPMLWILDRIVIPVASGAIFVRIGNLMNSEIIGKPTNSDYGFIFKQLGEDFPRHPTQLYEAFGYLITFVLLWYIYWKTDKKDKLGYLFGLFMVCLWSVRLIVEFFKEAQVDQRGDWDLNTGQLLSIPMILVGIYFMFRKSVKKA
ncbi:prolipoprotein diacylglyceryl transferase [Lutimonas zeaxanthinifaciens]|uniref:prolipoprotein diacylglyceryl transferase n=1 Tax=Lutimonas zeaxanthinifaciens TaxID=3060215 RepID=UPI00265CCEA1|nr:prolipoprotein diacylglyceryl transferase [Lutimonas sp. YSD2104]WKK64780.1 prolipoprotein diacylglyceryl transferase [Lutimonas sp. YSD2104]